MRWLAALGWLSFAGCGAGASPPGDAAEEATGLPVASTREPATDAAPAQSEAPLLMSDSGLGVLELEPGTGRVASLGDHVAVHFVGRLSDGRQFDSTYERGRPFEFDLGDAGVLDGFNEGIAGMRVRGKRRLIVPPSLAYGSKGAPPDIPPNAMLEFDVELVALE
jgi:FKBP-type peptidyl-prolyl cis-trans isomerase